MRRSLTLIVALHCMAVFVVLAVVAGRDAEAGTRDLALALGGGGLAADPVGATGLTLAFALLGILFTWMFATAAVARDWARDVSRLSTIPAMFVTALLAALSLADPATGGPAIFGAMLAALAATWIATGEGLSGGARADVADGRLVARQLAAQAAHRAMLPRMPGRPTATPTGAAP